MSRGSTDSRVIAVAAAGAFREVLCENSEAPRNEGRCLNMSVAYQEAKEFPVLFNSPGVE